MIRRPQTLFVTPDLPSTYDEVLQHLKREISQSGGVGLHDGRISWQDVVTKIFKASTHRVMQEQVSYVEQRLCWFLKRQKDSVLAWMQTLADSVGGGLGRSVRDESGFSANVASLIN